MKSVKDFNNNTHATKQSFHPTRFDGKIENLKSCGFTEYLNVKETAGDYAGFDHVIMTNTNSKSGYKNWVCDLYSNGTIAFLIYSKQTI